MTNTEKLVAVLGVAIIVGLIVSLWNRPEAVVIDEKHYKCTDAAPLGLGSYCTNYHYIGLE
jgi:hypothetical protein